MTPEQKETERVKHVLSNYDGCIRTFSGQKLSYTNPKTDQFDHTDIGVGLANKSHFCGQHHPAKYFSIASHSCLVLQLFQEDQGEDAKDKWDMAMEILLHDAAEAFMADIPKPLKVLIPEYNIIEERIQKVIYEKYGITKPNKALWKPYDIAAQVIEYEFFYNNVRRYCNSKYSIQGVDPVTACNNWINTFNIIQKER